MKVVGYIRVSTDEQAKSGLGLEAQERRIRQYADLYELDLVEIVTDPGYSGKSLNRPGIQRALSMLKAGQAEGLLVAKLDRLSRSVKDVGELADGILKKCQLLSVGEQIDTRSAAGRLVLNVLVSVAAWERETIGERTAAGLQSLRLRGKKTGGDVPFGYVSDQDGTLTPDLAEQRVIRQAESWRADGLSLHRIARRLNERGILTKAGATWKAPQVQRILADKRKAS